MGELSGRVALVTGAQQGIGRAIALAMAGSGADVAINYLDDDAAARAVAAEAEALGARTCLIQGDVGRVETGAALVEATVSALGRLDILVNNAGVFPRHTMLEATEADWDITHTVNLKGTFFCSQAAARHLIDAGKPGVILCIASLASMGDTPRGAPYAASKGGVVSLCRAMHHELISHGIRVNAIAPGLIDTAQPRGGHGEEELLEMGRAIPIGRIGQPEEIADLAVFLAGDKAAFMAGQIVHCNGGAYLPS